MSFAIGYLIGTVLLLVLVLYITRIRSPAVPGVPVDEDAAPDGAGEIEPTLELCDLCEQERDCEDVNGLLVCGDCREDFL